MKDHQFDSLFKPASVAIIGASEKASSIGRALITNLKKAGLEGDIYPINPNHAELFQLPAYPSVLEVKGPIDLAVIAIPIINVSKVIKDCGQAGVKAAIIISAGGKEVGPQGEKIEAAIKEEALKSGLRYLGPNCWGVLCPPARLHASFAPHLAQPGNLAFISQSGALCSSILGWATLKNIGFSHFINLGSKADIDFADLIDYLGNEERTRLRARKS